MIFTRYARLFETCPIWAWPWLQFFGIVAFTRRTGRKALFCVCPNGWVRIRFVADPPPPPGEHRFRPPPTARARPARTARHPAMDASLRWHHRC